MEQLWFTAILNKLLGGVVSALLGQIALIHGLEWVRPQDPTHAIPNYVAMEIFVILLLIGGALLLRSRLSVENPGKFQHAMEVLVQFIQSTAEEIIGHGSQQYVGLLGTLFIFVAACNLLS